MSPLYILVYYGDFLFTETLRYQEDTERLFLGLSAAALVKNFAK